MKRHLQAKGCLGQRCQREQPERVLTRHVQQECCVSHRSAPIVAVDRVPAQKQRRTPRVEIGNILVLVDRTGRIDQDRPVARRTPRGLPLTYQVLTIHAQRT